MQSNKYKWIILLALVLLVGVYFVFDNKPEEITSITKDNATSTPSISFDGSSGDYKIEQLPNGGANNVSVPDLNRKVVFGKGIEFDDNVKKIITEKILNLQTALKKDSRDLASWLDLGIYQKMAGDYEGAVLSWKYVSLVSDNDYISLGNLGDLYGYYIVDKNLSVDYYKKAIKRGPTQVYLYTQLSDVYKNVFKDLYLANVIIDEGLKNNPNDKILLQYKASLK